MDQYRSKKTREEKGKKDGELRYAEEEKKKEREDDVWRKRKSG